MDTLRNFLSFFVFLSSFYFFGQTNEIQIVATLNTEKNTLNIQQEITFFNKTDVELDTIYFHNWPSAYKDKFTPLAKRLIESYDKNFHFADIKNRGFTAIDSIKIDNSTLKWFVPENFPDVIGIVLPKKLPAHQSAKINLTYSVKIPSNRYTGYGSNNGNYYLRYWYLVPAIYQQKWLLQNNLDMDDLMVDFTHYNIRFTIPKTHFITTELSSTVTEKKDEKVYQLNGNNRQDIQINITKKPEFSSFKTDKTTLITNLNTTNLSLQTKKEISQRAFDFLEQNLGTYPFDAILINQVEYNKNPVYGFNQLPKILNPFSDVFEWDIKLFQTLTKRYLENTLMYQKRNDYWVINGIQTYLMMKYVETFYPEVKAIGNISKIWGIKSFNIAKLDFNDKYSYVFSAYNPR